ncbi:hypothetical protein QZH41_013098 [Actinostola sp. cb2023]|nr:hypothetical protein QZH41_013098 [Actinostola sp. cb2023]
MDSLKPPKPLSFEGNVADNWRRWLQQFNSSFNMNATGRDGKDEKIQYSTFLTIAGEDALEIYNTFTFEEAEANKVKSLIKKFEAYCNPRKNVTYERHKFNTRCQEPDEKIDRYVTELRKLAKSCEFSELTDSLIRDRIVCGILDGKVREKLLSEEDLNTSEHCACSRPWCMKLFAMVPRLVKRAVNAIAKITSQVFVEPSGMTLHSVEQQHESDGSEGLFVGTISTERQQS